MDRVFQAVEAGRCALAVSGNLLKDPTVMLALTERPTLASVALSGPAQAPVQPVSLTAIAPAVAVPGGVVVLVDPQGADDPGVAELCAAIRSAPHKPTVLVLARSFNPLTFMMLLPGVPVAQIKARSKELFQKLPMPPAAAEMPEIELPKKKAAQDSVPLVFVGRDEEQAALAAVLAEPGPVVVSGPYGVGRTWLVEHAIVEAGLRRMPDWMPARGSGFDTAIARIAEMCKSAGVLELAEKLASNEPGTPPERIALAIDCLQRAEGLGDAAWVIVRAERVFGREGDFFHQSALEVLVRALVSNTYPLRIVMISALQPVLFREGAAAGLRRFEVGGIKGRFLHEIFEAYRAPEFPRDKFGPLAERIHGHPMAARFAAIEVRERDNGVELVDDPKFMRMERLDAIEPVRKRILRRLDKIPRGARAAVARVAHLLYPVDGAFLADLGIGRRGRVELVQDGVLDYVGTREGRRYRVHPLVKSGLRIREITDFDVSRDLAERLRRMAQDAEGVEQLALLQEANRLAVASRAYRSRTRLDYPDADPDLNAVAAMIRAREPAFDIASKRLVDVLGRDPGNADAHLLRMELLSRSNAGPEAMEEAIEESVTAAPVPEVFHQAVGYELGRKSRGKAVALLERAVEVLPDVSRLRTRLASLLMRHARRKDAIAQLRMAMELDPMLPDAYGLLGTARRDEGVEALDEAEQLLREAVRLAPHDAVQISRLVDLLLARARVQADQRERLHGEARELLDEVLREGRRTGEAHILLANLLRDQDAEPERRQWLLDQAKEQIERHSIWVARLSLERAYLALAAGRSEQAEASFRKQAKQDPSHHSPFAGLARALEAQAQLIPAHAEFLRARERTSPNALERMEYDAEIARLQALIEAQAAGLIPQAHPGEESHDEVPPGIEQTSVAGVGHQRVIRRRRKHDETDALPEPAEVSEPAAAAPEAPDAAEAEVEAAEVTDDTAAEVVDAAEVADAEDAVAEDAVAEVVGAEDAVAEVVVAAAAEDAVTEDAAATEDAAVTEDAVAEDAAATEDAVAEDAAATEDAVAEDAVAEYAVAEPAVVEVTERADAAVADAADSDAGEAEAPEIGPESRPAGE